MYELRDASVAQRLTLAAAGAVSVALVWWLLFCRGGAAGARFGWSWRSGDTLRRGCLGVALSVYYVRILFTEFVFLKRGISWSEVFTIAPWLLCVFVGLGIAGGTNRAAFGVLGNIGIAFFVFGSWVNSYAEYTRHVWKERSENRGKLYTQGLFRYSRHPNYLGDLLSFSGLCLISGVWVTGFIPLLMLAGFVFVNIPILDSHLHDHYGVTFDEYAMRTPRLIPFVY